MSEVQKLRELDVHR